MICKDKDFCFYTVCVGVYETDSILCNILVAKKHKFYVFTDKVLDLPSCFVQIPVKPLGKNDRINSRYYKFFGCYFLPFKYSLYLDANIVVKSNVESVIEGKIADSVDISFFKHNKRRYVFEEIFYCYFFARIGFLDVLKSLLYLKFWGQKLFQGGVIFRNKKSKKIFKAMKKWWNLLYINFERDQIFGPIAFHIFSLDWDESSFSGVLHNSSFTKVIPHEIGNYKLDGNVRKKDFFQKILGFVYKLLWKK